MENLPKVRFSLLQCLGQNCADLILAGINHITQ